MPKNDAALRPGAAFSAPRTGLPRRTATAHGPPGIYRIGASGGPGRGSTVLLSGQAWARPLELSFQGLFQICFDIFVGFDAHG